MGVVLGDPSPSRLDNAPEPPDHRAPAPSPSVSSPTQGTPQKPKLPVFPA